MEILSEDFGRRGSEGVLTLRFEHGVHLWGFQYQGTM